MFKKIILLIFIISFNLFISVQIYKINIDNFTSTVIKSPNIWIIEYYSEMCGTCQEFYETWNSLTKSFEGVKFGRVNIDDKKGMELAKQEKALDNAIPAVRLIYGKNKYFNIMIGTEEPLPNVNELKRRIKKEIMKVSKINDKKIFIRDEQSDLL